MSNHNTIVEQMEAYLKEHAAFEEKGVKAAAARARKALGEIGKAVKERRKEIQDKKNGM
jgi:ElaB/YqjD/DUF883 family membrane-anchored ribosome-binding protein